MAEGCGVKSPLMWSVVCLRTRPRPPSYWYTIATKPIYRLYGKKGPSRRCYRTNWEKCKTCMTSTAAMDVLVGKQTFNFIKKKARMMNYCIKTWQKKSRSICEGKTYWSNKRPVRMDCLTFSYLIKLPPDTTW